MNARVARHVAAVALITACPVIAAAQDQHAPPTLTPLVARAAAAACPGTAVYADALVRGISDADAAAAAPLFDACAASLRRDHSDAPRNAASTAVGAVYLSRGLLHHDPALLRRAIDATAALRRDVLVSDDVVKAWPIIPDAFDAFRREAIISLNCVFSLGVDATYINVAASTGSAWITQPREPVACRPAKAVPHVAEIVDVRSRAWSEPNPFARPDPAIEPGLNAPVHPGP